MPSLQLAGIRSTVDYQTKRLLHHADVVQLATKQCNLTMSQGHRTTCLKPVLEQHTDVLVQDSWSQAARAHCLAAMALAGANK